MSVLMQQSLGDAKTELRDRLFLTNRRGESQLLTACWLDRFSTPCAAPHGELALRLEIELCLSGSSPLELRRKDRDS